MSFSDQLRYVSTPSLVPLISSMYFISLAPFHFRASMARSLVSRSTGRVLDIAYKMNAESVPAFLALAFLVHIHVRRQVDDLYQFGPGEFTRSAGSNVFRIASDPQLSQSVPTSQRDQQPERPPGEMVASKFGSNSIGDMTAVQAHV